MIMNVEYSKIKKAVPILLFLFVFSLVIDNSFKLISVAIADDLNISVTTVSWQATLAGLVIGIGAVVYASLSDAISIRTLFIYGVILIIIGINYWLHFPTSIRITFSWTYYSNCRFSCCRDIICDICCKVSF